MPSFFFVTCLFGNLRINCFIDSYLDRHPVEGASSLHATSNARKIEVFKNNPFVPLNYYRAEAIR